MIKRLIFILPTAIFFVVAGYFLWGLATDRDPNVVPSAMIDKPVPDFDLPPLKGVENPGLSDEDLAGGVALVNVFASWCVPCRAEHPVITALAEESGVPVHGLNYKDEPEAAVAWLEELGNPYMRIGADRSGRVAIDWGVVGVPETFIVDGEGRIRYRHWGMITPEDMEDTILPLIEDLRQ